MTHSTIVRSTLLAALLTAVSVSAPTGSVFAADDAACPHHNNDRAQACKHPGKHPGKYYSRGNKPSEAEMQQFRKRMEELALSDAQKQDMAALMSIYQPRIKALRERGEADREALYNAVPDADDYFVLVDKVSHEARKTAGELVVLLAELQANAYALLTAAQQAEYLQLKERAKAKAEERADRLREKARQRSGQKMSRGHKPSAKDSE